MTLQELDDALTKLLGFDLSNEGNRRIRDRILVAHGKYLLAAKENTCGRCWHKENGKCFAGCDLHNLPSDPMEASKKYLSEPNDISMFSFMCLFAIPIYEQDTGKKNVMVSLAKTFKRMWNKIHPSPPNVGEY